MTTASIGATTEHPAARDAMRSAIIARIATTTASGAPMIMPLYFVVLDGRIYMNNTRTSPTVRNIMHGSHALVLLEDGRGRVVRVRGTARFVQDTAITRRVARAAVRKYLLRPRMLMSAMRHRSLLRLRSQYTRERPDTGSIELTPESFEVGSA